MHEFTKGLISGICSSIICSPFDLIKTRYQVSGTKKSYINTLKHTFKNEGAKNALLNGFVGNLISVPVWWAMYWPIYEEIKKYPLPSGVPNGIQPMMAGNIASFILNPLFVLRVRIHNNVDTNYIRLFQELKKENFKVFTKGYFSTIIHNSQLFLNIPLYEYLKGEYTHDNDPWKSPKVALYSGLSKAIGGTLIYPIEVVRTRIRESRTPMSVKSVICNPSFRPFAGYIPYLIRTIPSTAAAFTIYEALREF